MGFRIAIIDRQIVRPSTNDDSIVYTILFVDNQKRFDIHTNFLRTIKAYCIEQSHLRINNSSGTSNRKDETIDLHRIYWRNAAAAP